MPESAIQHKIIDYLKSIGGYPVKVVAATLSGNPDIICCYRGRFVAIEVKQPGKNPTALQKLKMERIAEAGGIAFTARSVSDVKEALIQHNLS